MKLFLSLLVDAHPSIFVVSLFSSLFILNSDGVQKFNDSDLSTPYPYVVVLLAFILPIRAAFFAYNNFDDYFASRRSRYGRSKVDMEKKRIQYAFQVYAFLFFATAIFIFALTNFAEAVWYGYIF